MPTPVLPAAEDLRRLFDPAELHIETWPPEVTHGMLVPRLKLGVKVTHVPTGRTAVCEEHRAMHHNRNAALVDLARQLGRLRD